MKVYRPRDEMIEVLPEDRGRLYPDSCLYVRLEDLYARLDNVNGLNERQLAIVLCALRCLQIDVDGYVDNTGLSEGDECYGEYPLGDFATDNADTTTSKEIDEICEELNFGGK